MDCLERTLHCVNNTQTCTKNTPHCNSALAAPHLSTIQSCNGFGAVKNREWDYDKNQKGDQLE